MHLPRFDLLPPPNPLPRGGGARIGLVLCLVAGTAAAEPFSPARFIPSGPAALEVLLPEVPPGVGEAVARAGFYAGEPLSAGECAGCHAEIAAQWAGSAHRFASFNNPYYIASVELFRRERSPAASRFCAGCHDPLLLVSDVISRPGSLRALPAAQAGLPCLLCHSITAVHDARGNGSYTLTAAPVPPPSAAGETARPSAHGRRLRPPLLAQPALCAACHKVGLLPEITHDQWLRGQNDFDPWQHSLAAGHGALAVYRPEQVTVKRCQDCHMPLERGRSGAPFRSHRFLAANAALPALRGDGDMVARTAAFLRGAVSLDLVVNVPGGAETVPSLADRPAVPPGASLLIDAVLRNRRTGHRFPGGTVDSNEVWLEVSARAGDRVLMDATHLVRAQPVDGAGRPLMRRDPQNMRGVVYDTQVAPADPQVVRYRLELGALPGAREVEVRAALRYRKFSLDYAAFACADLPPGEGRARCQEPPVLLVSEARRVLVVSAKAVPAPPSPPASLPEGEGRQWERYLDHGLGLADGLVERAGEALPSLSRAAALAPDRPEPLLGLARMYLALARTEDVLAACQRADALRPDHPAGLMLRALALYRTYRWQAALPYLERAAELLPEDRGVLSLLARVRGLCGDAAGALAAAERILHIDPESEEGHYQRLLALRDLRRDAEAREAEARYLYHRRPVERDLELRRRFRALYPERADEDTPAHVHVLR